VFWRWFGACFAPAAVPFVLKWLGLLVDGRFVGPFLILGNAELSMAASILSSSAALDLYLISGRSETEKTNVSILALVTALIGAGFYGLASEASPGASTKYDWLVALVSVVVYGLAALASWFSLRIAEEVRAYDRD
jgi:hypothetical protein